MSELIKQLSAKTKALNIIESCLTGEHFTVAEKYIELYYKIFQDLIGYNELKKMLQDLRIESLSPKKN